MHVHRKYPPQAPPGVILDVEVLRRDDCIRRGREGAFPVFTPSPAGGQPADPCEIVRALAEKHGVRAVTGSGDLRPLEALDPDQIREARLFLRFRSGMAADEDPQTVVRGARILHAAADAPLTRRVLGLPSDPSDPEAADFSDVSAMLDGWAAQIHTPPRYDSGRHERTA